MSHEISSPHTHNQLSRRQVLTGLLAIAATGIVAEALTACSGDDGRDAVTKLGNESLSLGDIKGIRERAGELEKFSTEALASYLLDSEHVTFDPDTPRIRTSMQWAAEAGVFPLVDPEGDIKDGLEEVGPVTPIQKPILLTLALLNDAKIPVEVNSFATSSEHGQTSHHYQGRGVDLALGENTPEVLQFINALHTNKIVEIDELFAPNTHGYGLNQGKSSDMVEAGHVHFSTQYKPIQEVMPEPTLFEDASDNIKAVVDNLGIGVGSYFNVTREQGAKLAKEAGFAADGAKELLSPLFPAAVVEYKEAIEKAAKKYNLSPNFIASIISIETAGIPNSSSEAEAHGIIQVVPSQHRERIDKISGRDFDTDEQRAEYLIKHPKASIMIGTDFLAELLKKARKDNPGLDPNHPAIYARAAAGYNGGPSRTAQPFEEWPTESKKYANFMSAFYVDVSVASRLREMGVKDVELEAVLKSETIYARMVTFRALGASQPGLDYSTISKVYRKLEDQDPGCNNGDDGGERWIDDPTTRALYYLALPKAGFENFKHDAKDITPGLPPALTFLLGHGVIHQFNKSDANKAQARELAASYRN